MTGPNFPTSNQVDVKHRSIVETMERYGTSDVPSKVKVALDMCKEQFRRWQEAQGQAESDDPSKDKIGTVRKAIDGTLAVKVESDSLTGFPWLRVPADPCQWATNAGVKGFPKLAPVEGSPAWEAEQKDEQEDVPLVHCYRPGSMNRTFCGELCAVGQIAWEYRRSAPGMVTCPACLAAM